MRERPPEPRLRLAAEAAWFVFLFAAASLLFGVGAGRVGFMGKDERAYAQVGREVGPGSSLMVMHHLGNLYPEKPPLIFWLEATSYRLMGRSDPLAARLPLIGLGLLALLFAYLTLRQLDGPRVALIGAAALLVSFGFFREAKQVRLDLPMCAFTWGAFWASARIMFPARGRDYPGGIAWAWLAWTMAGLAILAKGPGALVWLGTILLYALASRRYAPVKWHWFWPGLAWMLAMVAAWFAPAATMGGIEYYGPMLKVHLVGRLADVMRDAPSIFFYFYRLPIDSLPMGLLIPAAVWWAWRKRRLSDGGRTLFIFCWLVFGLIFFTLAREKHGRYILPVYPAVALLAARLILAGLRARRPRRVVFAHVWLMILLVLVAVPVMIATLRFKPDLFPAEPPARFVILFLATLTLGGGAAGWLIRRHRLGSALGALAATVYLGYVVISFYYLPDIFNDRVPRQIAQELNRKLAAGEAVGFLKLDNAASLYMTAQPQWLKTADATRAFMANEDQRWLLTTNSGLEPIRNPGWPVVRQWTDRDPEPVLLLSNRVSKQPEVLYESSTK